MPKSDSYQSFAIRPARPDDLGAMPELFRAASNGASDYFVKQMGEADDSPLQSFERMFCDPDGDYSYTKCWIAEIDGHTVGIINGVPVGDKYDAGELNEDPVFHPFLELEMPNSWCLQILSVSPKARKLGIGSRLISLAEEEARRHAKTKVSLTVQEENTAAHRLYLKTGFVETDRKPLVGAPPIFVPKGDLIQMAKLLD